ncbi:cytochrome c oxidase subunit II transmembrane domain-containing protein [Bradyrhizobium sp. ISRA463]|uniref:cytochrome c oxidase subunit II transmembrane domain-containing protein n=1 Tax=Bradyrhizobium sp. ISRA463 TaxID=2866199 RepID=UPI00247A5FB2|nr:cytochrome c oxidase subunit II transmembrane domain-containing protein [Bradyrhizobium sp. ISRA463]WGS20570.1 hypothetical protein MTX22_01670 [Bradyrhizobium sp. ISRA463]
MSRMKNGLVFLVITLAVCGIASMFGVVASQDWVQRADASGVGKVVLGMPVDWELNFPYAGTPFGRDLFRFHNLLFSVDLAICSLVAILLFYSVWRFRKSRNAVPSERTHNTPSSSYGLCFRASSSWASPYPRLAWSIVTMSFRRAR